MYRQTLRFLEKAERGERTRFYNVESLPSRSYDDREDTVYTRVYIQTRLPPSLRVSPLASAGVARFYLRRSSSRRVPGSASRALVCVRPTTKIQRAPHDDE